MLIICLSYALYALDALYAWCAWYAWDAWYALCAWYALYCLEFVLFAGLCDHGAEVWPQVGRCLLWLHYSSGQSQHFVLSIIISLSHNMYTMSSTTSQNMNIFRVLLPDAMNMLKHKLSSWWFCFQEEFDYWWLCFQEHAFCEREPLSA